MINKAYIIVIFLFLFLILSPHVYAEGESLDSAGIPIFEVTYQAVNPSSSFNYNLKRLREKMILKVLFYSKDSKANYYEKLINVRLAELKYTIDKKDMANFEKTSQRYHTTVGEAVKSLRDNRLETKQIAMRNMLVSHIPVLEKLQGSFDDTTAEWRFVHDDINYVKQYVEILNN